MEYDRNYQTMAVAVKWPVLERGIMNKKESTEIRNVIERFILSTDKELSDRFNITLTKKSISGRARKIDDETYRIGGWRFILKKDIVEASCHQELGKNINSEVVVEIKTGTAGFYISDWYVKEFF